MSKKLLGCVMCLFILCFTVTVQAQDLCDKYQDKYRVCVEARDAGSNVDYDDCATYTNDTDCENAGCFWNDQGVPAPGTCVVDVCLADSDLSGRITGADLTVLKRDLGRVVSCPTTPSLPYPEPITCEGTLSALGRWCDNDDGTVTDMTTGLVWLKKADWGGVYPLIGTDLGDPDAHSRVAQLWDGSPYEGAAGLSDGSVEGDWRLPTKTELYNITVGTEWINSTHPYFFTDVAASYYWSSSRLPTSSQHAWLQSMNIIYGMYGMVSNTMHVWPVRGGQ